MGNIDEPSRWCPQGDGEFVAGLAACPVCGVDLVDEPPVEGDAEELAAEAEEEVLPEPALPLAAIAVVAAVGVLLGVAGAVIGSVALDVPNGFEDEARRLRLSVLSSPGEPGPALVGLLAAGAARWSGRAEAIPGRIALFALLCVAALSGVGLWQHLGEDDLRSDLGLRLAEAGGPALALVLALAGAWLLLRPDPA